MKTSWLDAGQPGAIEQAAAALLAGGVVVFPTDTVYGVGAHALQPEAIAALYRAKERPLDKAIPVLIACPEDLAKVARHIPASAWRLAARYWPGALTIVLPRAPELPSILCAGGDTVAVRMPDHPVALALIAAAGGAVAATSANLSGEVPALTAPEAAAALEGRVNLILDGGRVYTGVPSTIVDLSADPPRILRQGGLSEADLLAALN
ncbi:MAG: threonylcarbamoyl-AMP synthase [Chloroflexi bacterium]|nr:threonylcarbamoyl-AMP synthase [Chloroflexota bacterium]